MPLPVDVRSWRHRAAAGAVVTGMSLGIRDALGRDRDGPPIVVEEPEAEPDADEPVTLYLHPDVPEASLVVLRPGRVKGRPVDPR